MASPARSSPPPVAHGSEVVPGEAEEPAGPPVSLMATMVAVPITFIAISWIISILSLPTGQYGEFLAFGGSMLAFAFGVVVATVLSKLTRGEQIAIADLPREAHRLFDDVVGEISQRLQMRF